MANPLSILGGLALVVYVELRVPAELFYRHFGATADNAGFGNIDVVLQQSAQLLSFYAILGIAWALGYFLLLYPLLVTMRTVSLQGLGRSRILFAYSIGVVGILTIGAALVINVWLLAIPAMIAIFGLFLPRIMFKGEAKREREFAERRARRLGPVVALGGLGFSIFMLLIISVVAAGPSAADVKGGFVADSPFFPWHEHHAMVIWKRNPAPMKLPGCHRLTYLGQDSSRVLLYDEMNERTLRLTSADIELSFPDDC